jgi:hypothetical protein
MKRRLFGLAATTFALALCAPAAHAQMPVSVGVAGGASVPTSDLGDAENTGYNALIALGLRAPLLPVSLRFDGMYNYMGGKSISGLTVPDLRVMTANANVMYALPMGMVKPYLIGGIGMYNTKFDGQSGSTNDLGFNAGVGSQFSLGGLTAFGEARWHTIRNVGDGNQSAQFVPVSFGLMF